MIPSYTSATELVRHLKISKSTLYQRIAAGQFPPAESILGMKRWRTIELIEAGILDARVFAAIEAIAA